jgi:hypothetical protein
MPYVLPYRNMCLRKFKISLQGLVYIHYTYVIYWFLKHHVHIVCRMLPQWVVNGRKKL